MLGAALFFVHPVPQAEARRDPGLYRRRSADRPAGAAADSRPREHARGITEIGIALLLFIVGLELQPEPAVAAAQGHFRAWPGAGRAVRAGAVPVHPPGARRVAGSASWRSACRWRCHRPRRCCRCCARTGLLNTPQGERAFSILLFQDLAIVPMITIIAAMSRVPPDPDRAERLDPGALHRCSRSSGWSSPGASCIDPLFRLIGRLGERELFIVAGLFTVVGASALMHSLHLSMALGAFVAGVMLAESPYRHELESDVEPFRSILLGLFFLAVGMTLDLATIAARPLFVIGIAAAVIVIKGAGHDRGLGAAVRQSLAALGPARPAAQPGRRVRLRAVRAGRGGAIDHCPRRRRCSGAVVTCRWRRRRS